MKKAFMAVFFLLLAPPVTATYIQLSTTVTTESIIFGNEMQVNVTLKNTGDEPAYDVQLSLVLPDGFSSKDIYAGILSPEEPYSGTFNISIGDVLPGRHPMVVKANYADANGYPFSTLSSRFLVYREPSPIGVHGSLSNVELVGNEKKEILLTVRNLDDESHDVSIKLFMPNELKSDVKGKMVTVDGRSVGEEKFVIESFGALPGSTYVITATMSYEENGLMHSSLAGGVVKILEKGEGKKVESDNILFILVGTLILLVLLFLYLRR